MTEEFAQRLIQHNEIIDGHLKTINAAFNKMGGISNPQPKRNCKECDFCRRLEGHPRRFYCQMRVQKYHDGRMCFVRLKDSACEHFIPKDL